MPMQAEQQPSLYNNRRWWKKRSAFLRANPLCVDCMRQGKTVASVIADHVIPHRGDEALFWNGELQALCKLCHDSHKQRMEKSGRVVGCDIAGLPLDARHHWTRS